MNRITQWSLLVPFVFLSCGRKGPSDRAYEECAGHYLQAQHDYCATNIVVAEKGLVKYREWLSDPKHPCEPWLNREEVLFQLDARLFLVKEFLGATNLAENFYNESVEQYVKFLKSKHEPEHIISKEELRDRLTRQEKGLDVGWKKESKSR